MTKKTVYIPVENNNDLEIEINNVYNKTGILSAVGITERAFSLGISQFKKEELYTFTEEELNQYIERIINITLLRASEYAELEYECGNKSKKDCLAVYCHNCVEQIDRNSIFDAFEKIYQNFKV